MANELILILGGARSGKSTLAEKMARELGGESGVLFVATAEAHDDEMRFRIRKHQADRPAGWRTLEAPRELGARIPPALVGTERVVVVDCLTLLVSNLVCALPETVPVQEAERLAAAEIAALGAACRASSATWIVVSNDVGLGLVPDNPLGRTYRDGLGRANQQLAAAADQVFFPIAGLPLRLK